MKKWFMFQIWRLQQVAPILTLGLLAVNLSLQTFALVNWREGWLSNSYIGVPFFLTVIVVVIWGVSMIWDLKMKMWREQQSIMAERNPYVKEKMTAKEVVNYYLIFIPILEEAGLRDPKKKMRCETYKKWIRKALSEDSSLKTEVKELLEYIGEDIEPEIMFKECSQ